MSGELVPEALIRSIVAAYAPRRIVLFGSQARGASDPDSDLDLLVVLDDDAPPEALSWRRRHEARKGYDGAVDIIPCRERVLAERARAAGSFADTIVRHGVTVYERG
jgi:predicted nucleotidyltransferase